HASIAFLARLRGVLESGLTQPRLSSCARLLLSFADDASCACPVSPLFFPCLRQRKIPASWPNSSRPWRREVGREDSAQDVDRRKDRAAVHDLGARGIFERQ